MVHLLGNMKETQAKYLYSDKIERERKVNRADYIEDDMSRPRARISIFHATQWVESGNPDEYQNEHQKGGEYQKEDEEEEDQKENEYQNEEEKTKKAKKYHNEYQKEDEDQKNDWLSCYKYIRLYLATHLLGTR